jgi:hypothetical protein
MFYPEDAEPNKDTDKAEEQHLIFDGTVNLDYSDDNQIPQVKGLIELLNQFYINKPNQNL